MVAGSLERVPWHARSVAFLYLIYVDGYPPECGDGDPVQRGTQTGLNGSRNLSRALLNLILLDLTDIIRFPHLLNPPLC